MSEGLTRRHALGAAMAGVAVPALAACGSDDGPSSTATDTETPTSPTSPTSGTSTPASGSLTTTADIPVGGGVVFGDDGVVITQPTEGTFKGFTVTCTHQGCAVNSVSTTINCPCHGSKYSIEDGSVVAGPAPAPLTDVPLKVTGTKIDKA